MTTKHFGDWSDAELMALPINELVQLIKDFQAEDNFIIQTDSYKMTHHMLLPVGLQEVYSYLEPRGGEMPYTVFFGLQYYLKKYLAGRRITPEKIEEARKKNIEHFGFDCFNDKMWNHIVRKHDGYLPLEIKAVPEGTAVAVKNLLMAIKNTDEECAPLTNHTETLLMKLWASNTVAAYARMVRTLMLKYWALSSDAPRWLVDFMHHDFGYRGVSSEETAGILGLAALASGFKGTDTFKAITFGERYYNEPMAGFSVIASEHSVMCSYGGKAFELEAYRNIIRTVKERCANVNPASGVIILSLVSDTYNIYNVCHKILPALRDEFIGWKNNFGIPIKIVVRPDSGDPSSVLFGSEALPQILAATVTRLAQDMQISETEANSLLRKGVFGILFDQFGVTENSKGFKVLHPQIGVLQGDGVSYKSINALYQRMFALKIDSMNLVFGSGGKYLQAHDRDEQKYAIKATHVVVNSTSVAIEKDPFTDAGKKSKKGYLKLIQTGNYPEPWKNFKTITDSEPGFDTAVDYLQIVFLNGQLLNEQTLTQVRANAEIADAEFVTENENELELA